FTLVHVLLSLVGIGAGFVVVAGLLTRKRLNGWTALFLVTTVATSVTGFGFPVDHLLPSHIVGIISLLVLAVAIFALYGLHLRGAWRRIYVVCAAVALYLNIFVGVVQAFLKVPALQAARRWRPRHGHRCREGRQWVCLSKPIAAHARAWIRDPGSIGPPRWCGHPG